MKIDEVISQLEDLRSHCEDFVDEYDPGCIWVDDVEALDYAIKTLKRKSRLKKFFSRLMKKNPQPAS